MQMMQSTVGNLTVPGVPTANPALVIQAMADRPMRLQLANNGPTPIRLAYSSNSLGGVTSDGVAHYLLQPGQSAVFVMAPNQRLFAVSAGATGSLSYHASDALPFEAPPGAC